MFTGSLQVTSFGSTVGYVVALIPEKRSVIMGTTNPETRSWDMIQVGLLSDPLATAIRAHLKGPTPFALVCITPTQLTWLARKTASKGCAATPTSKMSVNINAAMFVPICSFAENVQFVHYLKVDVPSRVVIKDGPTGKYVTVYGNGYTALNVWMSDFVTEAMILGACGSSVVMTSIVCQKSGALLLRSTSGTTMIVDMALLPRGLVLDAAPVATMPTMAGFVDCFMPGVVEVCTPRKVYTAGLAGLLDLPPTPLSNVCTPVKSAETLCPGQELQPRYNLLGLSLLGSTPPRQQDVFTAQPGAFFTVPQQNARVKPNYTETVSATPTQLQASTRKIAHSNGLENPEKVTCYLNATIQFLLGCTQFQFQSVTSGAMLAIAEKAPFTITEHVNALIYHMYRTQSMHVHPKDLLATVRVVGQQDAQEFMVALLQAMVDDEVINKLFDVKTRQDIRCAECDGVQSTDDVCRVLDISLALGVENLQDILNHHFRSEALTGDNAYCCDACGRLTEARRHLTIITAPENLIISLKRYNFADGKTVKDMTTIRAQGMLVLPKTGVTYHLHAVLAHCGSDPKSGHYVASRSDGSGTWRTYDDAMIYDVPLDRLGSTVTPYIYLYSRAQLEAFPEIPVFEAMPIYESSVKTLATKDPTAAMVATPALMATKDPTAAMVSNTDMPMLAAWGSKKRLPDDDEGAPKPKSTKIDSWESPKNSPVVKPNNKELKDVVKEHDIEFLEGKQVMVDIKGSVMRVTVMGGGMSQVRVKDESGKVRRVMWSSLTAWAE